MKNTLSLEARKIMQNIKNPLLNKLNRVFFRALVPYKREIAAAKI